ncbi:hypothetical protein C4K25_2642 [Pseudomonas chlororaphis]|nr:hypothetical protein C4K25_2642 [Pseudomonas chlororaphis]
MCQGQRATGFYDGYAAERRLRQRLHRADNGWSRHLFKHLSD